HGSKIAYVVLTAYIVRIRQSGMEMAMAARTDGIGRVLILGVDPQTIPGVDAQEIREGLTRGLAEFEGTSLAPDQALIPLDESAEAEVAASLQLARYDCVVVGGGIRKPEPLLEFFETVINLIRRHAPSAVIAFNSDGTNSLAAAERALATQQP